ncbi:alpha-hydroxy-acid oxidizing protein [Escherichia coli]
MSWKDLEWIRDFWDGPMVIKGILDPEDARDAVRFGADGIVVSNHGGRQLDGVLSSACALPAIAGAVKGDIAILADSGIRNGLCRAYDCARCRHSTSGWCFLYALATAGQAGVANLLNLIEKEMKVAMTLTGATSISEITQDSLVQGLGKDVACGTGPDGERECGIVVCVPPLTLSLRELFSDQIFLSRRTGEAGVRGKGRTAHQFSAILPPH